MVALAGALLAGRPAPSVASSAPHWESVDIPLDCSGCHIGHVAADGALTVVEGSVNLCQSCHNAAGSAPDVAVHDVEEVVDVVRL